MIVESGEGPIETPVIQGRWLENAEILPNPNEHQLRRQPVGEMRRVLTESLGLGCWKVGVEKVR